MPKCQGHISGGCLFKRYALFYVSDAKFALDHRSLFLGSYGCIMIVGLGCHFTSDFDVEFDFRLGAGGADGDLGAVGGEELQHV